MHLLITGATGFIGKHVLLDALLDSRITKVTVVGRRPPSLDSTRMQDAKSAIVQKLRMVLREDLAAWDYERDAELVAALADCRACVWCIGGKADAFASPDAFERVSYTFALNAAAFLSKVAQAQAQAQAGADGGPLRFCYCSAKWASRGAKSGLGHGLGMLGFETQSRAMKGRVESALLALAADPHARIVVYVFRPGTVVERGTTVTSLGGLASTVAAAGLRVMPSLVINVERVARVLVDASVGIRVEWQRQEGGGKDTWESDEIVAWSLGLGV